MGEVSAGIPRPMSLSTSAPVTIPKGAWSDPAVRSREDAITAATVARHRSAIRRQGVVA